MRSSIVLLTVSLFACDGDGSDAVGTDGAGSSGAAVDSSTGGDSDASTTAVSDDSDATGSWWQTTGDATFTGGVEGGGTVGDTDGEFEEPETFAEWFGEGSIQPGVSYEGIVEFLAVSEGVEQCLMFFTPSDIQWVETCGECEFAFEYSLAEVEAKVSEGCTSVGVDPATIEGSVHRVGVAGKQLYRQLDGVWVPNGEAEYLPGKGVLTYSFSADSVFLQGVPEGHFPRHSQPAVRGYRAMADDTMTRTTAERKFSTEQVLEVAKTKLATALIKLGEEGVPDTHLETANALVFEAGELLDSVMMFRRAESGQSDPSNP